mmetsp:Transcript_70282/g.206153  ORF Transcript_70282/g.206153 Transcript_70282/m.206153 type:complete len:224 (-) Transcript_70282:101-772(-)
MSENATSGDARRPRAATRRAPGSPLIISLTPSGSGNGPSRCESAARAARASLRISDLRSPPCISSRTCALEFAGATMEAAGLTRLNRCLPAAALTPSESPSSVDESPSAVLRPLSPLPDWGSCGRLLYRRFIMLINRPVLLGFCTSGANATSFLTTLNWFAAAFRPNSCKTVWSSSPRLITPALHARSRHRRASWSSGARTRSCLAGRPVFAAPAWATAPLFL